MPKTPNGECLNLIFTGQKPGRVTSTYEIFYYNMYLNVLTKMGFITFIEKLKIQLSALLLVCDITFIVHENHR